MDREQFLRLYQDQKKNLTTRYYSTSKIEDLQNTNLSGEDLTGIKLTGSDLTGANFSYCNLTNADLSQCNLKDVDFSHAILVNTNLKRSNLHNVNCQNARFEKTNLTTCSFSYANLENAILTKSDLSYSSFNNCILNNADLSFVKIYRTKFQYATLIKVNFKSSIISSSEFRDLNLEETDFTEAKIDNSSFSNVNIKHSIFNPLIATKISFNQTDLTQLNTQEKKEIITLKVTDYYLNLLIRQQSDFIERYKQGALLTSDLSGFHSEITIINQSEIDNISNFCFQMIDKYSHNLNNSESKTLYSNFFKGKLGEYVVKTRLGEIINNIDYEKYEHGMDDGGIDLTLVKNSNIGIQVKTRTGNSMLDVDWYINQKEIEKNKLIVLMFINKEIDIKHSQYQIISAGFLITSRIKKDDLISVKARDLLYMGGIYDVLRHLEEKY